MGFTKLHGSILTSTIWLEDHHVVRVWIAMLAMKDIDGVVEGAVPGLAHVARVSLAECEEALAKFMAPDPHSRTQEHEGRRIERVDGGWRVLNHDKYRDKLDVEDQRAKANKRMQRLREKRRGDVTPVTGDAGDVTVRHADPYADLNTHPPDPVRPELPDPRPIVRADHGGEPIPSTAPVVVAAPPPAHARKGYEPRTRLPNVHRGKLASDALNYVALKRAELKAEGIDPQAPSIPITPSPADYGWNLLLDRTDELIAEDLATAADVMRHRIDVGVAEARRDHTVKYFAPAWLFDPKSFAIARAMSIEQAAKPRAGPSSPSPRGTPEPERRRLKPA